MKISKAELRSAKIQGLMLIGVLLGAIGLAVVSLCVRELFFEKYVREKFPEITEKVTRRAQFLVETNPANNPNPVESTEEEWLYAAWIQDEQLDPQGSLAQQLFELAPEHMLDRCCRTLVVGNIEQRQRALQLLSFAPPQDHVDEIRRLATYAREKSSRREEAALVTAADGLLARLPQGKNP
ncbi:hypothetical protein [Bremerella cremea]|uniref:hypothetical protein n=1 Tax=Bremerella cremea TaxID=1031537 RepID=UPI0031EDF4CE